MYTTLALAAVLGLAPGQTGKLTLTNIQPTYGLLGAPRPDNKVLPGDSLWVAFDIDNVKADEQGQVQYSMSLEAVDSKGKVQYRQEEDKSRFLTAVNYLGGTRVPAFSYLNIGLDMPPGVYTMKVTVTDRAAKAQASLEQKFEVLPLTFGLTRLSASYDTEGKLPAPMLGVPGQFINLNFGAVGFARDAKKQANLTVEMRILDEAKKPTLAKPFVGHFTDVPETLKLFPLQFPLGLNRPGKFTVELKATDNIAKKTSTLSFPLTVLPSGK